MTTDADAIRSVHEVLDQSTQGMELYFEGHRLKESIEEIVSSLESAKATVGRLTVLLAGLSPPREGTARGARSNAREQLARGVSQESLRLRRTTDALGVLLRELRRRRRSIGRLSRQVQRLWRVLRWALRKL